MCKDRSGRRRRGLWRGLEGLESRVVPAVFNVNSLADILSPPTGTVTLRSAVQAANTTPGPNTINLTVAGSYLITSSSQISDNTAGEFAILTTDNLLITNTSGGAAIVDGGGLNRVFDVNPTAAAISNTVTFQGFEITGGSVNRTSNNGGGIRALGGTNIVLNGMLLTDNVATKNGGGIAVGIDGGADTGSLTVLSSTFSNNRASGDGGGIEVASLGSVTLGIGTVLRDNTASTNGGGLAIDGAGRLTASGTEILNNSAITGAGGGVAIRGDGGGLTACLFEHNTAAADGGGFDDLSGLAALTFSNSLFESNSAGMFAGALEANGPLTTIDNCNLQSNFARSGGGALLVRGNTANLTNDRFAGNTALNGGAVSDATPNLNVINDTFDRNHTVGFQSTGGGGFGSVSGSGGAIDAESAALSTITVRGSLFLDNSASDGEFGRGGGLYQSAGSLTIMASQFQGNSALSEGGGLDFRGTVLKVTGATFNGNRTGTTSSVGGGIEFHASGTGSQLTNLTLTANSAGGYGGGLLVDGSQPLAIIHLTANNNFAGTRGGGVGNLSGVSISFLNSILVQNSTGVSGPDLSTSVPVVDLGGNFVGATSSSNGSTGFGASTLTGDPLLGVLSDNGGPSAGAPSSRRVVPTEALLPGSPAAEKGVLDSGLTTDARNFARSFAGEFPSIGATEPQYLPGASVGSVFVENLYEVLFNRKSDSGADAIVTLLHNGGSAVTAVQNLEATQEYRSDQIQAIYGQLFERAPTPAELAYWISGLAFGTSVEQIKSQLAGSDEYYGLHGSTTDTFLESLFADGLGRATDPSAGPYYSTELINGASRTSVAFQIFNSPEAISNLINADFLADLGRTADAPAIANNIKNFRNGTSDQILMGFILGSAESISKRA